jgi:hypothetical protein
MAELDEDHQKLLDRQPSLPAKRAGASIVPLRAMLVKGVRFQTVH